MHDSRESRLAQLDQHGQAYNDKARCLIVGKYKEAWKVLLIRGVQDCNRNRESASVSAKTIARLQVKARGLITSRNDYQTYKDSNEEVRTSKKEIDPTHEKCTQTNH